MKPPLTYFGGKQKLRDVILPLIPKHTLYCEPFFGGGAIFFAKEPSTVEVINDNNGELMNFYRVLKTQPEKLQKLLRTTLHSRRQYEEARIIYNHPALFTDVKRAWAVWVLSSMSFASKLNGNFGYDRKDNKTTKQVINRREAFGEHFQKRLENTQIECTDALSVIETRDTPASFFYCDPPYVGSEQGHYKGYTEKDFENLLEVLSKIKGKFLLSSYPSALLLRFTKKHGWYTKRIRQPLSIATSSKVKRRRKTEVLTANFPL